MEMKISMVVGLMVALLVPAVIIVAAQNPGAPDIPEGPEYGRDTAIAYVLANYPELGDLGDPSKIRTPWHEESLNPEGWVGSNAVRYTKGGWAVEVSSAVVRVPVYSVEIEFSGENAFCWKGTVDQDGNVSVIESHVRETVFLSFRNLILFAFIPRTCCILSCPLPVCDG